MKKTVEILKGDTPGTEWRFPVLSFEGGEAGAPGAYLQGALHGNELAGTVALHRLVPMLEAAEREGRLLGRVTIVPQANPIATGQHVFHEHLGRFGLQTRTNFNRDFPLLPSTDTSGLPGDDAPIPAEKRLKARLLKLALGHEIVLDLHSDDESPSYLYVARQLWPHLQDLASALDAKAILLWDNTSDGAFEEAAWSPYKALPAEDETWKRIAVTTVEFRGMTDVTPEFAEADAAGLYRFLVGRGTIRDEGVAPPVPWSGPVTPLDHVEMIRAPVGGALLFHVGPGDRVEAGQTLVTIVTAPGEAGGETIVEAPQAGLVLTRRRQRLTRIGEDLLKLLGSGPSATARPGSLES